MADGSSRVFPATAQLDPSVPVRVVFLGGLGEIGRNCMAIEQGAADDPDRTIVLIDCGLMFPEANMHGIDLILPDFTYLRENAQRLHGIVLTHGHEDHIGAIQYLLRDGDGIGDLRDEPLPVYGSKLTLGLASSRIDEAGLLGKIDRRPVADGDQVEIGSLLVEFVPVTHSVPHAHAIAVHTAQGVVLHSGDFKIDLTPVDDRRADLARIGQLAKTEGIRLLMSDSTNAEYVIDLRMRFRRPSRAETRCFRWRCRACSRFGRRLDTGCTTTGDRDTIRRASLSQYPPRDRSGSPVARRRGNRG